MYEKSVVSLIQVVQFALRLATNNTSSSFALQCRNQNQFTLTKHNFVTKGPPQFIIVSDHNITEVTDRLFVITGCYSFIIATNYNIIEVTKKLYVARDRHSSLWLKATTIRESQNWAIWVLFVKGFLLMSRDTGHQVRVINKTINTIMTMI